MPLRELFEKYGHVEVFAVEDGILQSYHENRFEDMTDRGIERELQRIGEFIPRYRAEIDTSYRQIIPYCMLIHGDKIFTTRRLDGDKRLLGKLSIGIGGHIERVDAAGKDFIGDALRRELDEEVDIGSNILDIRLVGNIYLDSSPVDSVHYGLVYEVLLDGLDVDVKETETLEGKWLTEPELMENREALEGWSLYCLENFYSKIDS